jgi:hypothetical protein
MGGFLGSFLGRLVGDEFRAWLPWFQERVVRAAVRKLPLEQRERYNEEWRSHLGEVPGELSKTWVALGFLRAAKTISSSRQFDFSRTVALAVYLLFLPIVSVVYVVAKINSRNRYVFPLVTPDKEYIMMSRYPPLGFILSYSLHPEPPVSRIYWEKCHYSSWRTPRLVALETFFWETGLIHLLSLGHVVLGRLSPRQWLEILVANLRETDKSQIE